MKRKLLTALLLVLVFTVALASCEYLCKNHEYEDGVCTKCGKEEPAPERFTVTFDSNGGTAVPSDEVTGGEKVTAPSDPTMEGYTFEGWYLGDEKWSFIGYVVTEDMTLTAKWTKNVYSVKIMDGETVISDLSIAHGEKITEPKKPEREGYIFDGWFFGDEEWSFDEDIVTDNIEIEAKWSAIMYTVKFMDSDHTVTTLRVQHGKAMTPPTSPTDEGRTFIGWFDNGLVWDFENSVVTDDLILEAKWLAYVIYVMDGGKNSKDNPETIYSDDEYPMALSDPTKSGYSFKGWYSDSSFTTKVENIASCREHTLYALWSKDNVNPSDYPWETTNLIFQMTENSNYMELPSTCRRYLAGDLEGFEDDVSTIDSWISDRNEAALEHANVTLTYEYLPDIPMYGWGQNVNIISEEVLSKEPGRPDMYCNFVYDMVAVSLKGAFANLLSTTMYNDDHELAGAEHNYFEFADPGYVDNGSGYMYDYMTSLTLSKDKMYCLASDYFIDMVRAFFVIPVNIALLETLEADMESDGLYNSDRAMTFDEYGYEKTNYTIEDFYELVYDKQWNYDTLANFAAAITTNEDEEQIDLRDTVGFALSSSTSMGACAMLYSTSITIIDREFDPIKGDFTYSYPGFYQSDAGNFLPTTGIHDELNSFCDNLSNLFKQYGVISVSSNQTLDYGATDLIAIRNRFASNNVLFGGVVCLGSLEYGEYKAMNDRGGTGYGIAPIPLYRASYKENGVTKTDKYNIQIHNIARIGAISYTTEKFAQCTAYLNYQSTHSTDILNEYYDYKLTYDVIGSRRGNSEMLKFIRENVGSAFDKTFEDALGKFFSATDEMAMSDQWHTKIKNAEFRFNSFDMIMEYQLLTPKKAWRLYTLENSIYPSLPN